MVVFSPAIGCSARGLQSRIWSPFGNGRLKVSRQCSWKRELKYSDKLLIFVGLIFDSDCWGLDSVSVPINSSSLVSVGTFPVSCSQKAKTCSFCPLQVTPSPWLLLCLVLLLSGKTFWSCVTYFPVMSVFCICCCHRLIWKGGFFFLQKSLTTLMKQSVLWEYKPAVCSGISESLLFLFFRTACMEGSSVNLC